MEVSVYIQLNCPVLYGPGPKRSQPALEFIPYQLWSCDEEYPSFLPVSPGVQHNHTIPVFPPHPQHSAVTWHICQTIRWTGSHPPGYRIWNTCIHVCTGEKRKRYAYAMFDIYEEKLEVCTLRDDEISESRPVFNCPTILRHWNENVVILMKFSSLAALEVVSLTTFSAASDENFIKMKTFPFQWLGYSWYLSGNTTQ